jgi:hypothetical protein
MYDIIGDVHGHAQLLKKLLLTLGYKKTESGYAHPERKAIFVGDFVNRGPQIKKTIRVIRSMVESGNALAILGNHELYLIIDHLRSRKPLSLRKDISVIKTVNEFSEEPEEWNDHIKWLRSLPLFLELDGLRIVHACWSDEAVEFIKQTLPPGKIKKDVFRKLRKEPDSPLSKNIWLLTKGILFNMPGDLKIISNKGISPRNFRIKWWEVPLDKTFGQLSFEAKYQLPEYTIPPQIMPKSLPYGENNPPLFFGHYCRKDGPHIISHNLCCIDACIAGSKTLLAYRWDGETALNEDKICRVKKTLF